MIIGYRIMELRWETQTMGIEKILFRKRTKKNARYY